MRTLAKRTATMVSIMALAVSGGIAVASTANAVTLTPPPSCSPTANKTVKDAFAKSHAVLKAGSDLKHVYATTTNGKIDEMKNETLDVHSKAYLLDWSRGEQRSKALLVLTSENKFVNPSGSTLVDLHSYMRVGDGYANTSAKNPLDVVTAQGKRLRTELGNPKLQWIKYVYRSDSNEYDSADPLFDANDFMLSQVKNVCFTVIPQKDGTTVYRNNSQVGKAGEPIQYMVTADGMIGRFSYRIDKTKVFNESFSYDRANINPSLAPETIVTYDKNVDAVLNKVAISDVGAKLAQNVQDAVNKAAAGKPLTAAQLRKVAYKVRDDAQGLYSLGYTPFPEGKIYLDLVESYSSHRYTYPFAMSGVTDGVRIHVAGGSSKAIYNVTVVNSKAAVTKVYAD